MSFRLSFLFLIFFLLCNAAVYKGAIKTNSKWHYLSKFCFSNEFDGNGLFTYKIFTNTAIAKNPQIMLYLGTDNSSAGNGAWEPAYNGKDTLSCQELVDMHRSSGIKDIESGKDNHFKPFDLVRSYYWYVAVADCDSTEGIDFTYDIQFTNPGNLWYREFSYDEQGVCQYYIFFTLIYILLLFVHLFGVYQLIKVESWHPIIRVLTTALTCQFLSCVSEMIHYLVYMANGFGSPDLLALGELLNMVTQIILMFLCILVAKGWAITTSYLSDKNILIVTVSLLMLSYLSLFIWDNAARDPASTLYFYDSVPGLIVIILRIGVAAWFLWCLRGTIGFEALPEKRKFYIIFGLCYTVWFLLLPGIVAIALAIPQQYQFRTVRGMSLSADTLAFIAFVILLSPSRAISFFNIKSTPQLLSDHDRSGYGTAKTFTEDL